MDFLKNLGAKWRANRSLVYVFALGMLVGPFVSSYFGIQVTSRTARAELHNGTIDLQASLCDARARVENKEPGKLDWDARRDLAAKFATMPGKDKPDSEVESLCSNKLAG